MTAATVTPQVMRDRLLQAVDGQSNISNMVVVMEVISFLEKYPITKEALEETRLGKLINDVRKKTKNEDLAKRAKKLLRNWQKLIEPGKVELLSKELNGSAHPCISTPAAAPLSGKTVPELKNRTDFNNCSRVEKVSNRKRKGDQKEGQRFQIKITSLNDQTQKSQQVLTNGLGDSCDVMNVCAHHHLDIPEHLDNKVSKIPIHAVKPHPNVQGYSKPPNTSSVLKASIQQQTRQEQAASGGQYQPRSPRCSLYNTQTPKHEAAVKQTGVPVPGLGLSAQPFSVCLQADCSRSAELDCQSTASSKSLHNSLPSSCSEGDGIEETPASNTEKRKKEKYRPKDFAGHSDGQKAGEVGRPVRLKDRRLTFDPVTGQIKQSCHKNSSQDGEVTLLGSSEQWSDQLRQNSPIPPSPFQQTDWKKLSRSEIIQSYLSQQSNMLTSSGAHTPGAHFFMTEFLKKEDHSYKDAKKAYSLVSYIPPKELPGVSREISSEDLNKLHTQRWAGVNGCYDTKGIWYDWTQCISLDPHGDESGLNILPYVCLD